MTRPARHPPPEFDETTPLRLDVAARIAFPGGGISASSLRRERDNGNLVIVPIAGKDFVTLQAIAEMREKCRVNPRVRGSGCAKPAAVPTEAPAPPCGSSLTEESSTALAAAQASVAKLKNGSPTTSRKSTGPKPSATVIPAKFR